MAQTMEEELRTTTATARPALRTMLRASCPSGLSGCRRDVRTVPGANAPGSSSLAHHEGRHKQVAGTHDMA